MKMKEGKEAIVREICFKCAVELYKEKLKAEWVTQEDVCITTDDIQTIINIASDLYFKSKPYWKDTHYAEYKKEMTENDK